MNPKGNTRLLSLDIFRGLTIAAMILVNNPGDWGALYAPLQHADWHGCTPTDWIFPFFLFIVGVAIPLALGRRKAAGTSMRDLHLKIAIRVAIIAGLGLLMAAFPRFGMTAGPFLLHYILLGAFLVLIFLRGVWAQPRHQHPVWIGRRRLAGWIALGIAVIMIGMGCFYYDLSRLRIPGVLMRIALVYGACSLLFLHCSARQLIYTSTGLLLGYWALMTLAPVPDGHPPNLDPETNIGAWFDRLILDGHLWSQSKTWDPEGVFSTLPAIVTGLLGVFVGLWLKSKRDLPEKIAGLMVGGALLLALGLMWDTVFPINKKIWTSSYVLYTGGVAMLILGTISWLVDWKKWNWWTKPFIVYGRNALFVFVLSGLVAKMLYYIKTSNAAGELTSLKSIIYNSLFVPWLPPKNASLAFALANVLFFLGIAWILYRRRIYIKV